MIISIANALAKYGPIENGIWLDESMWCVSYVIPAELNLINCEGSRQVHIYCNKDMQSALAQAFHNVISRGLSAELKTFDGCFMVRDVRAEPGKPSCHSYALAVDFNASTNQLGMTPSLSPELVQCFKDACFSWGGDFTRKDGMHFSYAWE